MGRRQSGGRRMYRYALRDDQWDKIKDFLPGREGHVGGTAADNRLFVDAVIYRYRTGIPWRDLPERYGHWKAVHRRYRRWCESGVFMRVFEIMSRDADNEFVMLDATIVRAHQHSAGAQKKTARTKRSAAICSNRLRSWLNDLIAHRIPNERRGRREVELAH